MGRVVEEKEDMTVKMKDIDRSKSFKYNHIQHIQIQLYDRKTNLIQSQKFKHGRHNLHNTCIHKTAVAGFNKKSKRHMQEFV